MIRYYRLQGHSRSSGPHKPQAPDERHSGKPPDRGRPRPGTAGNRRRLHHRSMSETRPCTGSCSAPSCSPARRRGPKRFLTSAAAANGWTCARVQASWPCPSARPACVVLEGNSRIWKPASGMRTARTQGAGSCAGRPCPERQWPSRPPAALSTRESPRECFRFPSMDAANGVPGLP